MMKLIFDCYMGSERGQGERRPIKIRLHAMIPYNYFPLAFHKYVGYLILEIIYSG